MPTVTTTVTSASAAGATTTVTTTEATPEDAGFTYDGTFNSWLVKGTPEQFGKYLTFDKHLGGPVITEAFDSYECDGNALGSARKVYLKGLEPGQFVTEICIGQSDSGYAYQMTDGGEMFNFKHGSYRGAFSVVAAHDGYSTITWTNTYMTSDAAATRAALGPFAALMGGSWAAMSAEFNPNDPVYINGPIWSEPGMGLAFGVSQVVKIGGGYKISGAVSCDANAEVLCVGDIEGQMKNAYKDLAAVLEQIGCSFDDVVVEKIYTTEMSKFVSVSEYRKSIYTKHFPTATWAEVTALGLPELLIEIELEVYPATADVKPDYFQLRPKVEGREAYGYTHACKIGDGIKISGAVSMTDEGIATCEGDLEQQMKNAYADLDTILKHYGCTFDDVVYEKIYTTDMAAWNEKAIGSGYRAKNIYPNGFPTGTRVEVKGLALPGFMIEIELEVLVKSEDPAKKPEYFKLRPECEDSFGYQHAVKIDGGIKVSGAVSASHDGKPLCAGDMEAQMKNIYSDLAQVLAHYGYSFDDVVVEKLFTTDMPQFLTMCEYRKSIYTKHFPTADWAEVKGMCLPEFMLEIELEVYAPTKGAPINYL